MRTVLSKNAVIKLVDHPNWPNIAVNFKAKGEISRFNSISKQTVEFFLLEKKINGFFYVRFKFFCFTSFKKLIN